MQMITILSFQTTRDKKMEINKLDWLILIAPIGLVILSIIVIIEHKPDSTLCEQLLAQHEPELTLCEQYSEQEEIKAHYVEGQKLYKINNVWVDESTLLWSCKNG